jgi:hypothetical protein
MVMNQSTTESIPRAPKERYHGRVRWIQQSGIAHELGEYGLQPSTDLNTVTVKV